MHFMVIVQGIPQLETAAFGENPEPDAAIRRIPPASGFDVSGLGPSRDDNTARTGWD